MAFKVLIVDDQAEIREFLKQFLEMVGFEAITAANGKEGLRRLFETQPDVVITDLCMPEMDGNEFSALVRKVCDTPIILLTGVNPNPSDADGPRPYDDYVLKPVRLVELEDRVNSLIRRRNLINTPNLSSHEFGDRSALVFSDTVDYQAATPASKWSKN